MSMLERRRKVVAVVFTIFALYLVVVFVSDLMELSLMNRIVGGEEISDATADANDTRQAIVGGIQFLLYIVAVVVFLRWIHYAYKRLDPSLRRWTPGWAIGGWFVPILWLWRPKQIVNDLWNAGGSPPPAALLTAWWTAWLVSNWFDNIALRAMFKDNTAEQLRDAAAASAVADVLEFAAAILALVMVRAVTRRLQATGGIMPASTWTSPERPPGLAT
jgi:Domain of unknown function (DUF4328)